MQNLHVVYITDENYVMPTCVSIVSLKETRAAGTNYQIFILLNSVSAEGKQKLSSLSEETFEIRFIEVKNEEYSELANTCLTKDITVTESALYKFDIANILADIDKVLYLDGDTLINKDISELFNMDMSNVYVAAVDDMGDTYTADGKSALATQIGLCTQKYFNSGVLLLNLRKMREDKIYDRLIKYRWEQCNYFMDQDALNSVMGGKRASLPYCYNFRTAVFDVMDIEEINNRFFEGRYADIDSCLKDQSIIHMSDRLKPWKYNFPWITELFLKFYNKSPYAAIRIQLLSPIKAVNDNNKKICKDICDRNQAYIYELTKRIKEKIWRFPFDKIRKGSRLALYGAGRVGRDLYRQISESGYCSIVCWVDKDYENKPDHVASPEKIRFCEYDYIVIALAEKRMIDEVKETLLIWGADQRKIIDLEK